MALGRLVVSGAVTIMTQRYQLVQCASSQLQDLSRDCVTTETSTDTLCAGYCPTLVTLVNVPSNTTQIRNDCFTPDATTKPRLEFIGTNLSQEEQLRTSGCVAFEYSASIGALQLTDVYTYNSASGCPEAVAADLVKLEQAGLVNELTKSVGISYVLFAPNTNLLIMVEAVVSFEAGDSRASTATSIVSVRLDPYGFSQNYGVIRIVIEVLVTLAMVYLSFRTARKALRQGYSFIYGATHILDVALIAIYFTTLGFWFYLVWHVYNIVPLCSATGDLRADRVELLQRTEYIRQSAFAARNYQLVVVILLFVIVMQTFRVLTFQAYLKMLILTMKQSASLLFSLLIMVFYTFATFSFVAHLAFGGKDSNFNSISRVVPRLFAMMIGELNYSDLYEANPDVAPIFLIFFVVVVSLVVLNLVIAVIIHSFEKEAEHLDLNRPMFGKVAKLSQIVRKTVTRFASKMSQTIQAQQNATMPADIEPESELVEMDTVQATVNANADDDKELRESLIEHFGKLEQMHTDMTNQVEQLKQLMARFSKPQA